MTEESPETVELTKEEVVGLALKSPSAEEVTMADSSSKTVLRDQALAEAEAAEDSGEPAPEVEANELTEDSTVDNV